MTSHNAERLSGISCTPFLARVWLSCSPPAQSSEENPQPVVTVQTAPVERGKIQQIVTAEAILFPRDQAAITPKGCRAGEDVLCESWQPRASRPIAGGAGEPRSRGR